MLELLLLALRQTYVLLGTIRSSFPLPLNPQEEAEAVRRMIAGDAAARQKLIEHNLRLVAHVAKKYQNTGLDNDDLIGIGTIGLIKAVQTYNPRTGTQLATYAARCIHNEILMTLRAAKKSRGDISLHEAIGSDREGNEIALMDILPADEEEIAETIEKRIETVRLSRFIRTRLLPRERTVLELRYGLLGDIPMAQREVAQLLGISRSYVSRIEKKAIQKLLRALQEEGPCTGGGTPPTS